MIIFHNRLVIMKVLLVSPYHGGSHAAWAEGYAKRSAHEIVLLSLPARYWKWRMHGGAITLAQQFNASGFSPDLILATDMLDLTTFLAMTRRRMAHIPAVLYMHENQLTYPLPKNGRTGPMRRQLGERDQHYAFINYASMMAADHVYFNSNYHRASFYEALLPFLKHYPEFNELESIQKLQEKSAVLPVGITFPDKTQTVEKATYPLILWNQRWEYDKNPELFFETLFRLSNEGHSFQLAICGEAFGKRPLIFEEAQTKLSDHIIHMGFANYEQYEQLLWQADIVVSTAVHEFFGISILEAIGRETLPILPKRLSYPELFPNTVHDKIFYNAEEHLYQKLLTAVSNVRSFDRLTKELAAIVKQYRWKEMAPKYDSLFTSL